MPRLALTAVTEDKDIAVGLVLGTPVEVHKHVTAVFVSPKIEAVFIGFAAVIQGIEVSHRTRRKYSLILTSEHIHSARKHRQEAFFLSEDKSVYGYLCSCELHSCIVLELPQLIITICFQLNKNGAVEERLLVAVHITDKLYDIVDVVLSLYNQILQLR